MIKNQTIMDAYRNTFRTSFVSDKVVVICSLLILMAMASSCKNSPGKDPDMKLRQEAERICRANLIVDSHIDWPDIALAHPGDLSIQTSYEDFDLPPG